MSNIRQNLFFAFIHNSPVFRSLLVCSTPSTVSCSLPIIAAAAMTLSSASVVVADGLCVAHGFIVEADVVVSIERGSTRVITVSPRVAGGRVATSHHCPGEPTGVASAPNFRIGVDPAQSAAAPGMPAWTEFSGVSACPSLATPSLSERERSSVIREIGRKQHPRATRAPPL
jgi:hypothetical protein